MPSDLKDPLTSCAQSQRDKKLSSQQCHRKESPRNISKRSVPYLFWIEEKVSAHPDVVVRRFSRIRFTLAVRPEDSSLLTASSRISEHPTVNCDPAPCRILHTVSHLAHCVAHHIPRRIFRPMSHSGCIKSAASELKRHVSPREIRDRGNVIFHNLVVSTPSLLGECSTY
jgi:hypothetical protein